MTDEALDGDKTSRLDRKSFLSATAIAASAAALTSCRSRNEQAVAQRLGHVFYPVLTPDLYDYTGMMAKLRTSNPHKQLFPATTAQVQPPAGIATIFMHMQFGMNGYQFSLPGGGAKLATIGVFSGPAILFSLNDAMWRAYDLGRRFNLASTNIYYRATSPLDPHAAPDDPKGMYQDFTGQAVLARGASFMVCHHALTYHAADCALRGGKEPKAVLDEWVRNLLPGFMIVPSGITVIQLAAENGWKIYPVG